MQAFVNRHPIYHITNVNNLSSIIAAGGLWCDRERLARRLDTIGIAHRHIKDRRARKVVPCCRGGTLADYVPFYFAPRSPMLYAIARGQVAGYDGGQEEIVHLCSTVETIREAGVPFAFTDGHADMFSDFFTGMTDLDRIDWAVMKARYWHDTDEDGDRKRRRQAEFLAHTFVPWRCMMAIGTMTQRIAAAVQQIVAGAGHKPAVLLRLEWYY